MDAIEVARRRAASINAELIAAGADIRLPYELATAASDMAGVEVQRVAKGSAILNGARAIYDPDMPVIIHEATGSDFEDAFLVAHCPSSDHLAQFGSWISGVSASSLG